MVDRSLEENAFLIDSIFSTILISCLDMLIIPSCLDFPGFLTLLLQCFISSVRVQTFFYAFLFNILGEKPTQRKLQRALAVKEPSYEINSLFLYGFV